MDYVGLMAFVVFNVSLEFRECFYGYESVFLMFFNSYCVFLDNFGLRVFLH